MRREENILQSIWEGKKYLAHQVARKKNSCWPEITHPPPTPFKSYISSSWPRRKEASAYTDSIQNRRHAASLRPEGSWPLWNKKENQTVPLGTNRTVIFLERGRCGKYWKQLFSKINCLHTWYVWQKKNCSHRVEKPVTGYWKNKISKLKFRRKICSCLFFKQSSLFLHFCSDERII